MRFQYLNLSNFISQEITLFAPKLAKSIETVSLRNSTIDAIFCKGLPVFKDSNNFDSLILAAAKCFALSISRLVGEPFQYKQQNDGQIVAEIKPISKLEHTESSGGRIEFGWHTDDCFFKPEFRTKWISLQGYYNPDLVNTKLVFISDVVNNIRDKTLNILMSKRFKVRVPVSISSKEYWTTPISIIRINGDQQYEVSVPTFDVLPYDDKDKEAYFALEELVNEIDKAQKSCCISDDSVLIFNNDKLLHAREAIPGDRLIFRTYIKRSLEELRNQTGEIQSHIFDVKAILNVGGL
jgi:hypothetical protein